MPTEPSAQTVAPSPQFAKRPGHLLIASAALLGLCWPAAVCAGLPVVADVEAIYWLLLTLLITGSLLWLLSCRLICRLLFSADAARWPAKRPVLIASCFLGWPLSLMVGARLGALIEHPGWIDLSLIIPGTILWLGSCREICDTLFTMAEARWPGTKAIREIMGALLKVLPHHDYSSD